MNNDFFSDNNKNLLHNLIKNKILELDNVNIDNYPELKQNLETTLISVYRQGKYPNIVEFNKRVLQECIQLLRRLVNTGKSNTPNMNTNKQTNKNNPDINMDMLITEINRTNQPKKHNQVNDQLILNNIKSSGDDAMRDMYQRTVDMRTPSKEKPAEIDFIEPIEDISKLDMSQEYEKKMLERNNMPVFHEPSKNKNNTPTTLNDNPSNDIEKLLDDIQKNSKTINNNNLKEDKIRTEIVQVESVNNNTQHINNNTQHINNITQHINNITQHITINSALRYNLISSRYNYKVKLDKFIDSPKSIKSIELLRLFIPIDSENIFDYPILNIKIPELDNIIFKMSKVSEIETNKMKYAVYNPVVNRGYFPIPNKSIEDINVINIKYYDFFNYPIQNTSVSPDIIIIKNLEFNKDNTIITLEGRYTDIHVGNIIQIKQILKNNSLTNQRRFLFNNIVHTIIEIEETNIEKSNVCTKLTIDYPKALLKGLRVKQINEIKNSMNMYLIILNLQQEILFKVSYTN